MRRRIKVNNIFSLIYKYRLLHAIKKENKKNYEIYRKNGIEIKKISREQKNAIDDVYKKYGFKYTYDTHILAYSVTGKFDARIMPEDMFRMYVGNKLNHKAYKEVFSNKGYFEMFMPEAKFPNVIIRNIGNCLYDKDFNPITEEKANNILSVYNKVVVKPIKDSGKGRGVYLVEVSEENPLSVIPKNYVVQEVFRQHPALEDLNKTSVNCVRLVTLFWENEVHLLGAMLKIGGEGEFADNSTSLKSGRGRMIIGINKDGKLSDNGYLTGGQKINTLHNGSSFAGYEIPCFNAMVEEVKKQHCKFPVIKFVAWDVTLTANEEVVIMEYNTQNPGIQFIQYTNGSIFGDLTETVMEFAKNNK